MIVAGADPDQLRATAAQFGRATEILRNALGSLNGIVSNAGIWRGPDALRFRSEWEGRSVAALNAAITSLDGAAESLRRHADEQVAASQVTGDSGLAGRHTPDVCYESAPNGLRDMWNELSDIPKESSGYRVQKVVDESGQERYIVYIGGTDGSQTQTWLSNANAISGELDREQVAALQRLIPRDAEVMLVGYSQGGIDAQNIAAADYFNVTQLVTFGSPVRNDVNIPAVHLQYSEDIVPHLSAVNPGLYSAAGHSDNDQVEVFSSRPNLFTIFGLGEHVGGYGGLAEKWDGASAGETDQRAHDAADGFARFSGDVVDQVDIDPKGRGSW